MSEKSDSNFALPLATLLVLLLIYSLGFFVGREAGKKQTRQEATKLELGAWVPDEYGNTTFHWKPSPTATPER